MDEMERPHCRQRYPGELGRLSSASPHTWPVPFREGQGVLFPRNTGGKETTARGGCHVVLSRSRFPQCSCGSILLRTLSSTLEHTSDTPAPLSSPHCDLTPCIPRRYLKESLFMTLGLQKQFRRRCEGKWDNRRTWSWGKQTPSIGQDLAQDQSSIIAAVITTDII